MHIDAAIERHELAAQDGIDQPLACHHPPRLAQQDFEEIEFDRSQLDWLACALYRTSSWIEFYISDAENFRYSIGGFPRLCPAQNRPDPRHQFARVERLGKIIIGADFQPYDAVHIFTARSQKQYGNFRHAANAP